jgi:hypothetical protein
MSNMDEIIEEIYAPSPEADVKNNQRWPNTKSGWNKMKTADGNKHAETIRKAIDAVLELTPLQTRATTRFSIVRREEQINAWRKEEALERLIVAANDGKTPKISNQCRVSSDNVKENADLHITDNEDRSIAELKYDTGTPMLALIELVKNANLYVKEYRKRLKSLIVIAPQFYYRDFASESAVKAFFAVIDRLTSNGDIPPIKVISIGITEDAMQAAITEFARESAVDWRGSGRTKYDFIAEVDARDIIRKSRPLQGVLLWPKFREIRNSDDWLKQSSH